MVPFGFSCAWATPTRPSPAAEPPKAAAAVTPSLERKSRRDGRSDMVAPFVLDLRLEPWGASMGRLQKSIYPVVDRGLGTYPARLAEDLDGCLKIRSRRRFAASGRPSARGPGSSGA